MRSLIILTLMISLASTVLAQRVSPKNGFFSVVPPQGWDPTVAGDVLIFSESSAHAQITASLLDERGSFSDAREIFESRGFRITSNDERMFHGFRCLYAYGDNAARVQKGVVYYCLARRGSQRWSVFLMYIVDYDYEKRFAPTLDSFLDNFRWDGDVKDDH